MFSCEICKNFKNTFFLRTTSGGWFRVDRTDRVRSTWKFLLSLGATNRLYSRKMKIYNKKNYENAASLITLDRHLITGSRVFAWHKLSSTETDSLMILNILSKPSFSIYFKNLFNDNDIDWVAIFTLLLLVTYNTYMRSF